MHEWVGNCQRCGIDIYCGNGFFNGVLLSGHEYRCFECDEIMDEEPSKQYE